MLCNRSTRTLCRYLSAFHAQSSSTLVQVRLSATPKRDHSPSPHFMGTWTERLKRRWQSGDQSKDSGKTEEVKTEAEAEAEGSTGELQQTLNEREEQIKANEEKIKDLQDKYLRALAEAENTRTRLTRQVDEAKKFAIQDFAKDVVEVADILDKAVGSVKEEDLQDNTPLVTLFEGLKLTEAELHKVMGKNGLERIDKDGVMFDPNIHEALFEVPGDNHGTVAMISRVGYILQGRTVRPARVGVVKAPES